MEDEIKYKIQRIKLQRIQELNLKLKESLLRPRIHTSQACLSIINYTLSTPDYLIPSLWKLPPDQNKYQKYQIYKTTRRLAPKSSGCCTIM